MTPPAFPFRDREVDEVAGKSEHVVVGNQLLVPTDRLGGGSDRDDERSYGAQCLVGNVGKLEARDVLDPRTGHIPNLPHMRP